MGARIGAVAIWLGLASLWPTGALASGQWLVSKANGVALTLVGDQWREVQQGESFADPVLRTLSRAELELTSGGVTISVGPVSAVRIREDGKSTWVQQYAGSLSLSANRKRTGMIVQSGNLAIAGITGVVNVTFAPTATLVVVSSGVASIAVAGGQYVQVASGDVIEADHRSNSYTVLEPEATSAASGKSTAAVGNGGGNGNGNAGGNGNGNAGGNGNGNAGGNGNGNAGGNGNGNAGGNGNGNAGGNGNGNAGGNGNGNAGGNGNGNAGGNGNGSTGGSGNSGKSSSSNSVNGNGKARGNSAGSTSE